MTGRLLLYGSTGYTGELIAREADRRGLAPILPGRDGEKVGALADELSSEGRVFDLADPVHTAECTAPS